MMILHLVCEGLTEETSPSGMPSAQKNVREIKRTSSVFRWGHPRVWRDYQIRLSLFPVRQERTGSSWEDGFVRAPTIVKVQGHSHDLAGSRFEICLTHAGTSVLHSTVDGGVFDFRIRPSRGCIDLILESTGFSPARRSHFGSTQGGSRVDRHGFRRSRSVGDGAI